MSNIGDFENARLEDAEAVSKDLETALRGADRRGARAPGEPVEIEPGEPFNLEPREPVEISFERLWNEALERNPELAEQGRDEDWELAKRYCPTRYVPLGESAPLEQAIVSYQCNGHQHPVTVFAPARTANWIDGRPVAPAEMPQGYNLHDALHGAYDGICANILYFLQSWCFHPGAVPGPGPGNGIGSIPGSPTRQVLVVDTARMAAQGTKGRYADDGLLDPWEDAVSGHGHAIADLIGRMTNGGEDKCKLFGMRPIGGHSYYFEYTGGEHVRAFSQDMLIENLKAADATYSDAEVLNLSLGTSCPPAAMVNDPIGQWIDGWVSDGFTKGLDRQVVAAAGNHQTCVPNWPAAHCADWSNPVEATVKGKHGKTHRYRDRIYSVGSHKLDQSKNNKKVPFSAKDDDRDSWITDERLGRDVKVECPDPLDDAWTGTSFAAPQFAAELAK